MLKDRTDRAVSARRVLVSTDDECAHAPTIDIAVARKSVRVGRLRHTIVARPGIDLRRETATLMALTLELRLEPERHVVWCGHQAARRLHHGVGLGCDEIPAVRPRPVVARSASPLMAPRDLLGRVI